MQHLKLPRPPVSCCHLSRSPRHQHGMTLVEWLVSIAIGLILLTGLTALIAQQSSTQAELEKSSRQIENGRYAMQLLNEDIQMAGYYGEFSKVGDLTVPGALPDPCSTAAGDIEAAMPLSVQGYDSPATTTGLLSCINAADHVAGTDILVIRRVEPATLTIAAAASAAAGQVYLQSGLTGSGLEFTKKMGTGTDASGTAVFTLFKKDGTTPASLRKFLVHIYFVSPCSVKAGVNCSSTDDGGKPIPTLKMLELSASGMTTTPLVEGIENMQIDYGVDATGDGAPDGQFVASPVALPLAVPPILTVPGAWSNLVALRIHLLARNNDSSPGYVDPKTYSLGYDSSASVQTVTPATDAYGNDATQFKRRVFSQMVRLVNPSSRRDQ